MPPDEEQLQLIAENEPEAPVEEKPVEQAQAEPEAPAEETKEPEVAAEPASKEEVHDWREKQINKQHGKIQELKRALEERERTIAELAASRAAAAEKGDELPTPPVRQQPASVDPQAVKSQVELELRLEALNKSGEETYKDDWQKALNRLVQIGDGTLPDLPWIAKAVDNPEKVIHALGMNPAEALRISELPPERRQAEYFRIAMKEAPKPSKPSAAPAPVDPVRPRSQPSTTLSDDMSDDDWYAKRAEQRKAHRAARGMR